MQGAALASRAVRLLAARSRAAPWRRSFSSQIVGGAEGGKADRTYPPPGEKMAGEEIDSQDQVLRNRLLAQATLRETAKGPNEIIEATKSAMKQKSMREQAQTLGDGDSCGAEQRPQVVAVEKERKTPLVDELKEKMKLGPIPVSEYMSAVLSHPNVSHPFNIFIADALQVSEILRKKCALRSELSAARLLHETARFRGERRLHDRARNLTALWRDGTRSTITSHLLRCRMPHADAK